MYIVCTYMIVYSYLGIKNCLFFAKIANYSAHIMDICIGCTYLLLRHDYHVLEKRNGFKTILNTKYVHPVYIYMSFFSKMLIYPLNSIYIMYIYIECTYIVINQRLREVKHVLIPKNGFKTCLNTKYVHSVYIHVFLLQNAYLSPKQHTYNVYMHRVYIYND